jgi:acetate kinase
VPPPARNILTINTGSSSLKAGLYRADGAELVLRMSMLAERIGLMKARFRVFDDGGKARTDQRRELPDFDSALREVFKELGSRQIDAIGHRVVHGGSRYAQPEQVGSELLDALRALTPIDPLHLPQAIDTMEGASSFLPEVPQVACFDTAFHRAMPRVAQIYALPRELTEAGIVRYGFHGLSYEYILEQLRTIDPAAARGRVIVAHLGNGASMVATRDGKSVDTTMGFTPTGGLVMGTRSGDLDPGVLVYLAADRAMSPMQISDLLTRQSGLLGVSGRSSDMRELLDAREKDPQSSEAVELFCYRGRQFIGSLAAVLGGLDTLVFTGGIGEHAAEVRRGMCTGLDFLGIRLDESENDKNAAIISTEGGAATVRVIPTDEDQMIARHTQRLLWGQGAQHVPV